jgi:hypothetical protein
VTAHQFGQGACRLKRSDGASASVNDQQPGRSLFQDRPIPQTHPKLLVLPQAVGGHHRFNQQAFLAERKRRGDLTRARQARQAQSQASHAAEESVFDNLTLPEQGHVARCEHPKRPEVCRPYSAPAARAD